MDDLLIRWVVGGAVALGADIVVGPLLYLLRRYMRMPPGRQTNKTRLPRPFVLGILERLFFTPVVAFSVGGAAISMIAWTGLKMAANWSRPGDHPAFLDELTRIHGAMSALMGGILSMLFALLAGLICAGKIPVPQLIIRLFSG